MDMTSEEFDAMLRQYSGAVQRLVYYRIPSKADAEDILQETFLSAFANYSSLRDKSRFKPWLITIANNHCNRYFRKRIQEATVPLDDAWVSAKGRAGETVRESVEETLFQLREQEQQLLRFYYFQELSVGKIAQRLRIPSGTVKSRLYAARQAFKRKYPCMPTLKGEWLMNSIQFPKVLPELQIVKSDAPVFPVVFEELPGWFVIPRLHEKAGFAVYPYPSKMCDEIEWMEVKGKAMIHGVPCVEITCTQTDKGHIPHPDYTLYASVDEQYVRYLANCHFHGDIKTLTTFLDDDFLKDWGIGENNCGRETHLKSMGRITEREDGKIVTDGSRYPDIVGVYDVSLGKKRFHTVKFVEHLEQGIYTESYIDESGRTVLWKRYNQINWEAGKDRRYPVNWSQKLPENEKITVDGEPYIHWFDCISDYIL